MIRVSPVQKFPPTLSPCKSVESQWPWLSASFTHRRPSLIAGPCSSRGTLAAGGWPASVRGTDSLTRPGKPPPMRSTLLHCHVRCPRPPPAPSSEEGLGKKPHLFESRRDPLRLRHRLIREWQRSTYFVYTYTMPPPPPPQGYEEHSRRPSLPDIRIRHCRSPLPTVRFENLSPIFYVPLVPSFDFERTNRIEEPLLAPFFTFGARHGEHVDENFTSREPLASARSAQVAR